MKSIKHTIQCHCVLPQYRKLENPIFHKFIVFSVIDDSDTLQSKYVKCNHCSAVHKVYDVCKSEICIGKEDSLSVLEKKDIQLMLPTDIFDIMDSYDCDISDFEHALFILQNKKFEEKVLLTREILEEEVVGKFLTFKSQGKAMIETFVEKFNETF